MRLSLFLSTTLLAFLSAGCESHRNDARQLGCAGDCTLNKQTVVLWCSSKANLYTREPAERETVFEDCLAGNGYAKRGVPKPPGARAPASGKSRSPGRKKPGNQITGTRDFDPRDLFTFTDRDSGPPDRSAFTSD